MLIELQVRDFLIIESLDLSFNKGMAVITGETGAGKSMLLDALQFSMGERSSPKVIRTGKSRAEVSVQCVLNPHHPVCILFQEWGIDLSRDHAYVLKRILTQDARSKAFINGQMISMAQLKQVGMLLFNWVGQYEHQALLQHSAQLAALDDFNRNSALRQDVASVARQLKKCTTVFAQLKDQAKKEQERLAFKNEELELLNHLGLTQHEWPELHEEHKKLSAGGELLASIQVLLNLLRGDENNIISQVKQVEKSAQTLAGQFKELQSAASLSTDASVALAEAYFELKNFYDSLELDPERLIEIEARLSEIHRVARKLHQQAEELFNYHAHLKQELAYTSLDEQIAEAAQDLENTKAMYSAKAQHLTVVRAAAARELAEHVDREMKTLGMKEGQFKILLQTDAESFGEEGQDHVEFYVRMNPGQNWAALKEGASGGELSRIALIIAVANVCRNESQTLVFDEVDVGISGAVAEKVGQLLHQLGQDTQVLCITHLPQVAMCGDYHIHVSKEFKLEQTFGSAKMLNGVERIEEVARLMSGENITEHARQLAREGLRRQAPDLNMSAG